jgi:hypothetical protein
VCVCMYLRMYKNASARECIVYVCMHTKTYMLTRIHTNIKTHTTSLNTYIHAHVHTYTGLQEGYLINSLNTYQRLAIINSIDISKVEATSSRTPNRTHSSLREHEQMGRRDASFHAHESGESLTELRHSGSPRTPSNYMHGIVVTTPPREDSAHGTPRGQTGRFETPEDGEARTHSRGTPHTGRAQAISAAHPVREDPSHAGASTRANSVTESTRDRDSHVTVVTPLTSRRGRTVFASAQSECGLALGSVVRPHSERRGFCGEEPRSPLAKVTWLLFVCVYMCE